VLALLPAPRPADDLALMADRFVALGVRASTVKARRRAVTTFQSSFDHIAGWTGSSVDARRAAPVDVRGFAAWLALSCAQPVDAAYVVVCASSWGYQAGIVFAEFAVRFREIADRLGFTPKEINRQWATAAKMATVAGVAPRMLNRPRFDRARAALAAALSRIHNGQLPITFTTPLHGLGDRGGLSHIRTRSCMTKSYATGHVCRNAWELSVSRSVGLTTC
jgi:hypothetical protein